MDDKALGTAWRKFPGLKSVLHFTQNIEGRMPDSPEERYWSMGYLRSDKDLPGAELSYGVYPDIHGDDYYGYHWDGGILKNSKEVYVISGRDILLVSKSYTREEVEGLLLVERAHPVDDLGGLGWTTGEDGSEYIVQHPNMTSSEAKLLATTDAEDLGRSVQVHNGVVEDRLIKTDCHVDYAWQCIDPDPLSIVNPPIMRTSLLRLKEQQAGHILVRLERDNRPRGYERKLIRHHLQTKHHKWYELPPFEITEDMVLRYNSDLIEVLGMGASRGETLYYRSESGPSVG